MCNLLYLLFVIEHYKHIISGYPFPKMISRPPLNPWVVVKKDGVIVFTRCDCVAGLGESCSHIGAVIFALRAEAKLKYGKTCTDVPCHWLSSPKSNIQYLPAHSLDMKKQ